MKKMVGSLLMTSALLLGSVAPVVANADSIQTASTKTTAAFEAGDQVTKPVDPDNPDKPTDPDTGTNTVDPIPTGKLALIYAPKTLDFGTHKVDVLNEQSYGADGNDSAGTNLATTNTTSLFNNNAVLEVSDVRGTSAGWSLSASASALTKDSDTLKGATIALPSGSLTNSGSSDNGVTTSDLTLQTDDSAQTILNATSGNGAGVTVDQMTPKNIKLNVLANTAKAGTYTGTLTWNLSDTPAN